MQKMENVQVLIPIDSKVYWQQLRTLIEEVMLERMPQPQKMSDERPLLKIKEVCEIFYISKPTIYKWMRQGKVKSVKIQSRRFFDKKDIDEFIQTNKAITQDINDVHV